MSMVAFSILELETVQASVWWVFVALALPYKGAFSDMVLLEVPLFCVSRCTIVVGRISLPIMLRMSLVRG